MDLSNSILGQLQLGVLMKIYELDKFLEKTMGGRENQAIMGAYDGKPFECACGKTHSFYDASINVIRELPGMRFVIECPEADFVTCARITIFTAKFKSLFGAKDG